MDKKYLKVAGVYIVSITNVSKLSNDSRFADLIKQGQRKDCYIVEFETKNGFYAQQRFYPPLDTDSQSAKEFKDKKVTEFCKLGGFADFTDESMLMMKGKVIKALFRQKEYLSTPEPGKMYLNETMEYMWGASVEDTIQFNEQFAVKRLSPADQARFEQHKAAYQAQQNPEAQAAPTPSSEVEDDLPF